MLRKNTFFAAIATFTLFSSGAAATTSYDAERKLFSKASSLLNNNRISEYQTIRKQLDNYPLAPYLDYTLHIKQKDSLTQERVSHFLQSNAELPLANRLNRSWLNHLAKQQRWGEYAQHYAQYPVENPHYLCNYQVALLNGNAQQKQQALANARELWLVGNSQPDSCDPLFKDWMASGGLKQQDAYARFWLSIEQGNLKLARYIDKQITAKKLKAATTNFWKLQDKPELLESGFLSNLPKEKRSLAAVSSYQKWFRAQPISATESWIKHRSRWVPVAEQQQVTEYMGIRLNRNYHSQAIELSHKLDPTFSYPALTESRIRNALAKQDWKTVNTAIQHLPDEEKTDAKWQYWLAVSELHLNPQENHLSELKSIAQDRSYYGFLAAELSDAPFLLNAQSGQSSNSDLRKLETLPAVLRARELYKLNRLIDANREWNLALSQMTEAEQLTAGYLAKSWGWHLQAIINAAKTQRWDHVDLRFPHPHQQLFAQHAVKNGLDLSFPVAIARQESAFLHNAQSRVGARGLMQLMPKTAKATARKHKVKYSGTSQLSQPELNITLGSAYLGDMFKRFNHNPAFAAAAYNAGPHRVDRWLKERGDLPLDIWIETIPFTETRNYVQNVLAFRVIYDRLQGRQASLLSDKQTQLLALNQNAIMPL